MASVFGDGVRVSLNVLELDEEEFYMEILERVESLCLEFHVEEPKVTQIFTSEPLGSGNGFMFVFDRNMNKLEQEILEQQRQRKNVE